MVSYYEDSLSQLRFNWDWENDQDKIAGEIANMDMKVEEVWVDTGGRGMVPVEPEDLVPGVGDLEPEPVRPQVDLSGEELDKPRADDLPPPRDINIKIPKGKMSAEDLKFIQLEMPPKLDISFSKQSIQRSYPETLNTDLPTSFYYDFSATIKQIIAHI